MAPPTRARKRDVVLSLPNLVLLAIIACSALGVFRYSRIRSAKALARRLGVDGFFGYKPRAVRDEAARALALRLAEDALYRDTAIITLATGDAAAKHAVVLVQALRDTNTVVPRIVVLLSRGGMGSEDCHNET